eukprot:TRINITY_DN8844_c0_g1_i2.p1 TRINITY_DN8844_c0_g1~~TRINITY_DN8844_c0_g1_i2.p1  ORF type:complete len:553 (-),score=106.67 TRINITY_DN8844_c0_g1_i2:5-1477(-)
MKKIAVAENMYPSIGEFDRMSVKEFREVYQTLENEDLMLDVTVDICGRLLSKRIAGKKLVFLVVAEGDHQMQIKCMAGNIDHDVLEEIRLLRRGDIIRATGHPHRTQRGELSLMTQNIRMLTPCLHELVDFNAISDIEIKHRQRYLDLMVNKGVRDRFVARAKIIKNLRDFLNDRDFVEVETPLLHSGPSGASADPFTTHYNSLNKNVYLRIAPELYLKKLIIGGMDRVYEIGKSFRNEGIDHTHNPEFTTCEFYQAYADYNKVMEMTEEMIKYIAVNTIGTFIITLNKGKENEYEIDFSKPFKRISVVQEIEDKVGKSIDFNIDTPENIKYIKTICIENNIPFDDEDNLMDLFDVLVSHYIEPYCKEPTFLKDYPVISSPLAKNHRNNPGLVERFELIINGMEICNAYSEMNDPFLQANNFDIQNAGNKDQATIIEENNYVRALEYGLPPTGGWGMGIDRLCMLLLGINSIREVILFPTLKQREIVIDK